MQPRFMYEEAQAVLDTFARNPKRLRSFARTYRKLKFMLAAYAFVDFDSRKGDEEGSKELALSYAWEDLQVAFTGHGEMVLGGCILQLWANLRKKEHALFRKAIMKAFKAAEEATSEEAPRRYLHQYRVKPPRKPEEDWDLPCILPMSGVMLADWAIDSDEDPEEVTQQWSWLEMADRSEHTSYDPHIEMGHGQEWQPTRRHLRLVEEP